MAQTMQWQRQDSSLCGSAFPLDPWRPRRRTAGARSRVGQVRQVCWAGGGWQPLPGTTSVSFSRLVSSSQCQCRGGGCQAQGYPGVASRPGPAQHAPARQAKPRAALRPLPAQGRARVTHRIFGSKYTNSRWAGPEALAVTRAIREPQGHWDQ